MADEEEYFIEPLSPGANVSAGGEGKGSPHVVYKRSSLQYPHMDAACGVLGRCSVGIRSLKPSEMPLPQFRCRRDHLPVWDLFDGKYEREREKEIENRCVGHKKRVTGTE